MLILTLFLTFLLNYMYTLWHPLELPYGGNSNGIPKCVGLWTIIEIVSNSQVLL